MQGDSLIKKIVMVAIVAILGVGGWAVWQMSQESPLPTVDQTIQKAQKMNGTNNVSSANEQPAPSSGTFATFTGNLEPTDNKTVLFFHKDRVCAVCAQIEENLNEGGVPTGLIVYKVDYDTYGDLVSRYNIAGWYSFIEVDSAGNAVGDPWRGNFGTDGQDIAEMVI